MQSYLVIGHHFVVGPNRAMWNLLPNVAECQVDVICPQNWRSNLFSQYQFQYAPHVDCYFRNLYPLPVYFSGRGSLYHYHWRDFWHRLWKQHYHAIIIAQEAWSLALLQLILCKFLSPNWRAELHVVVNENLKRRRWLGMVEWILARAVTRFWGCSQECHHILKWKGIQRPFSLLPFSIDEELYRPYLDSRQTTSEKNSWTIGFMGRLTDDKGLPELLAAVEMLKKKWPLTLRIAGSGPMEASLTTSGAIMLGAIPHHQAHHFYRDIDLFVLPSRTTARWKEQFGRVLVEAAAAGVPVIGSSSGAIPEVLGHLGLGQANIFAEKDAEDLARKIESILSNRASPALELQIRNAQHLAFARFGHRPTASQTATILSTPV